MSGELELLDEIYLFCVSRATEAAAAARERDDTDARLQAQRMLQILLEMRLSVLNNPASAAATTEYLRLYAMQNRGHPDFRPEWVQQH